MIHRMRNAWVVLAAVFAPALGWGEPSVRLLRSPVPAGELVRLEAHVEGGLKAPLRGVAALGTVSPFVQVGPDTYRADYTPGSRVGPALVQLVVYEDRAGGQVAVTQANVADAVHAQAKVKSREPVFVRAGAVRSGPFHPDAHGLVALDFTANGELTQALLESAQGKPLGVVPLRPALLRTLLVARPSRLHAGSNPPAEVLLVAPHATPTRREVRLAASAGTVSPGATSTPQGLRYAFTPPPTLGEPIRVQALDARGQKLGEARFTIAGPQPQTVSLRLPTKKLAPGERATVGVNLADAKDQPADAEITVSTDLGQLAPPVALGPGTYAVSFTAPARLPPEGQARLHVQVLGEELAADGIIALRGGPPARIVFHGPDHPLRAGESATLEAEVLDQGGNPAEPRALSLSADQGEVSAPEPRGGSRYAFTVKGADDAAGLTLSAHDGETALVGTQSLTLERSPTLPSALLGLQGGVASNLGEVSSPSLAVTGQLLVGPRGSVPVRGAVGFLAGYLPQTTRTLRSDADTAGELQLARVALLARAGAFGAAGPLALYGGLAAGVVKLSGQLTSVGRAPLPLDLVRPGLGLYGGAGLRLGPGYLGLELAATQASVDVENGELRAHGPVGGLNGALSYLFVL